MRVIDFTLHQDEGSAPHFHIVVDWEFTAPKNESPKGENKGNK